jgi:hypothetical protein
VALRPARFRNLVAANGISDEPPFTRRGDEWRQRDPRACRRKAGAGFLITSVNQLEIKGAFSMETKQPKPMKGRAEVIVAALALVVSIATGSAVLAQDLSAKPLTPPVADKMGMGADGSGMMGMGSDGKGMMGMGSDGKGMMGMMSRMQQMKCCGQGMGHSDHGASEKQDEKK